MDSDSDSAQGDKDRLLGILQAHGQQFLSSFAIAIAPKGETNNSPDSQSESEGEWEGINWESSDTEDNSKTTSIQDDDNSVGFEQEDDGFTASSLRTADVTVFSGSACKKAEASISAKQLKKLFMSSKVTNVTSSSTQPESKDKTPDGESDDERTNTQNDALLHRLVHTKLLSGSLNPELNLNHAQRGRALAGRVLELAGDAKLGKGESKFRHELRNKAAKHIREGLVRKQREREKKSLEEAKNLGNYHPTLKRLYDASLPSMPKKRARGLGIGVGKFSGGTLRLRREEIASVTGTKTRPRHNGRRGARSRPR